MESQIEDMARLEVIPVFKFGETGELAFLETTKRGQVVPPRLERVG